MHVREESRSQATAPLDLVRYSVFVDPLVGCRLDEGGGRGLSDREASQSRAADTHSSTLRALDNLVE